MFFKRKEDKKEERNILKETNYENDIKFLNITIDDEVTRTIKNHKLSIDNKHPLKSDKVTQLVEETSTKVISVLSESYLSILNMYYNEDGIVYYVTSRISDYLLDYAHNHNLSILSKNRTKTVEDFE